MDTLSHAISHYFSKLAVETSQIARELDGTGWAVLSGVLLVCGWFFLRGNKIGTT